MGQVGHSKQITERPTTEENVSPVKASSGSDKNNKKNKEPNYCLYGEYSPISRSLREDEGDIKKTSTKDNQKQNNKLKLLPSSIIKAQRKKHYDSLKPPPRGKESNKECDGKQKKLSGIPLTTGETVVVLEDSTPAVRKYPIGRRNIIENRNAARGEDNFLPYTPERDRDANVPISKSGEKRGRMWNQVATKADSSLSVTDTGKGKVESELQGLEVQNHFEKKVEETGFLDQTGGGNRFLITG